MEGWSREECVEIEAVVAERLEGMLEPGERLEIAGESGPESVLARLELTGVQAGARLGLEARVDFARSGLDPEAARFLALDALDLLLLEWLDSDRTVRFSGVWEERELEGKPISIRAERSFPELDAQADALLERPKPE